MLTGLSTKTLPGMCHHLLPVHSLPLFPSAFMVIKRQWSCSLCVFPDGSILSRSHQIYSHYESVPNLRDPYSSPLPLFRHWLDKESQDELDNILLLTPIAFLDVM